jgi:hypothetical protein
MNSMNTKVLMVMLVLSACFAVAEIDVLTVSLDESYLMQLLGTSLEPDELEFISKEISTMDAAFKQALLKGLESDGENQLAMQIKEYVHIVKNNYNTPSTLSDEELRKIQSSKTDLEIILKQAYE